MPGRTLGRIPLSFLGDVHSGSGGIINLEGTSNSILLIMCEYKN